MPIPEEQLGDLKRAYQTLGVPLSASAPSIKQTYRRLIGRWHPDRYLNGSPSQVEATHMTQLINQAYSEIKHAPLRYYVGASPLAQEGKTEGTRPSANEPISRNCRPVPEIARLEFRVRFVCGALFGLIVSFRLMMDIFEHPTILALAIAAAVLGFGFAAARYGDKFWYLIFRHWWFWS